MTFLAIISFMATTSTVTATPVAPSTSAAPSSSSHAVPSYWWEGDPSKEIPEVKAALQEAEGQQTLTGYEDKDVLIPLIKKSLRENQTGGVDEVRFIRLCALVYRGRNAPGIEDEPYYKTAKNHTDLVLRHWDRKVDSLSFIRMCTLMRYEFSYSGPKPDLKFIDEIRPYIKNDPVFDQAMVKFMGFQLKRYPAEEVLKEARKLARQKRATIINARTAGEAMQNVAFLSKDPDLLLEGIALKEKYLAGMQPRDPETVERWKGNIKRIREIAREWRSGR